MDLNPSLQANTGQNKQVISAIIQTAFPVCNPNGEDAFGKRVGSQGQISIGDGVVANGFQSIVIGYNNNPPYWNVGPNGVISIGTNITYGGAAYAHIGSVILGNNLTVQEPWSICIGYNANIQPGYGNGYDISLGYNASSTNSSIAIGYNTVAASAGASTSEAIAIGYNASVYASSGIAIGNNTIVNGLYSAIGGIAIGQTAVINTASATHAIAIGTSTTNSNANSIALGYSSSNTGSGGIAIGYSTTVSSQNGTALGALSKATLQGQVSFGNDNLIGTSSRTSILRAANSSTSATPVILYLDGVTGTQRITLQNNSVNNFFIELVGKITGATGGLISVQIVGAISKGTTSASVALLGTPSVTVIGADSTATTGLWSASVLADTTNAALQINATGAASQTISWFAWVELTELIF